MTYTEIGPGRQDAMNVRVTKDRAILGGKAVTVAKGELLVEA